MQPWYINTDVGKDSIGRHGGQLSREVRLRKNGGRQRYVLQDIQELDSGERLQAPFAGTQLDICQLNILVQQTSLRRSLTVLYWYKGLSVDTCVSDTIAATCQSS